MPEPDDAAATRAGDHAAAPLGEADREALRARLVEERAAAARRLASLERTFAEMVDAADLEPPDDEHDPEGTTAYERAQVTSLAAEARATLAAIGDALAGLDEPGFGACERCGAPIGLARLEAVPGTTRCVACAAAG